MSECEVLEDFRNNADGTAYYKLSEHQEVNLYFSFKQPHNESKVHSNGLNNTTQLFKEILC